ncbi:MAG: hypothetical protein LBK06_09920 [Planctomycetaceae bacterium]|jgi:hypothetical protein|nr:hypothetical protein [Planctomycetaceae bacterium]
MGTSLSDIPSLLPSGWFSFVPQQEVDKIVKNAVAETADIFFDKLSPKNSHTAKQPSPADVQIASDALRNKLAEIIESNYWIETLCGEETTSEQRGYLRLHLRKLVVPLAIPDLSHVQTEVRTKVMATVTAITTALGFIVGSWISGWVGIADGSCLVLGSVLGAVVGICGVMFLAGNEKLRKRLLLGLGIAAAVDAAVFWLRGKTLVLRGSFLSVIKRFCFYVGLAVIAFVSKREKVFNYDNYRKEVEAMIEQWLHSVIVIFVVLTYKINSLEQNPFNRYADDKNKLNAVVSIVKRLKKADPNDTEITIIELVQELESCGFNFDDETNDNFCNNNSNQLPNPQNLIWNESQNKLYNPIGILRNGDNFQIIEEPIIRDEIIERKGIARKRR